MNSSHANADSGRAGFGRKSSCFVVLPVRLPGDTRTKIGFLTFDSTIHFYNLQEGLSQPQMLVVSDIDGTFAPPISPNSRPQGGFYILDTVKSEVIVTFEVI